MDVTSVIKALYDAVRVFEPDEDEIQRMKDEIEMGAVLCCHRGPIMLQVVMSDFTCLINNVVWTLKSDVGSLETHEFSTETDYVPRFKGFVETLFCNDLVTEADLYLHYSGVV